MDQTFGKGELEITAEDFDCCGMRHRITDAGYELDQIEYLQELKPINNEQLTRGRGDDPAYAINAKLYVSGYGHDTSAHDSLGPACVPDSTSKMAAGTMLPTHQEDQYDSKVGPETPQKALVSVDDMQPQTRVSLRLGTPP